MSLGCQIGKNCSIGSRVSFLRPRWVRIGDNCTIEPNVRFKANSARQATAECSLEIGSNCFIGYGTIIDAYIEVSIGPDTMIGPYCFITDSDHSFDDPSVLLRAQKVKYEPVIIEGNAWLLRFAKVM